METKLIVIAGFERYAVNSNGQVKNIARGNILKNRKAGRGYIQYCLGAGNYVSAHRIVATAFIPNPHKKPTVNHKDGNKENNSASNLEWATTFENMKHAYDNGFLANTACCNPKSGKDHKKSKSVDQLNIDGIYIKTFPSMRIAAKETKSQQSSISQVISGKLNKTNGFKWRYSNV